MQKIVFCFTILVTIFFISPSVAGQSKKDFAVIAYYAGNNPAHLDSFCHLKGNRLNVDDAGDTAMIQKLVSLKKRNPDLKVMLSLGGWGGCATCSDVFSSNEGRVVFSQSVKELSGYFGTDGIDLDWEYPAIEGYPNHKYQAQDKENFTKLVKQLRKTLGNKSVISFAAGGFNKFIDEAVEW